VIRGWFEVGSRETERDMALARKIVGGLMMLIGGIWFLQGVNVLPGSFMTGSTFWAVTGAATLVVGLLVFAPFGNRASRP
jgi:hypothetical protein